LIAPSFLPLYNLNVKTNTKAKPPLAELRHILFIMCDQLRWDYLSCYGHPHLKTPNIDGLAAEGVRFDQAFVQSPICGPSRMSFYTGRYVSSHGSTWNNTPLRVDEYTLGDYLLPLGWRNVLVGKTHMRGDEEGMYRLGVEPDSFIGAHLSECGFEPYERDDGLHPGDGEYGTETTYNAYLREHGFVSENPWHDWANAGEDPESGEVASGWFMKNAHLPARVPEEHSETPYMTRRAMEFIGNAGDEPWCLHLSYIKPHWPYIVPAPYHNMFGVDDVIPAVKSPGEAQSAHPVCRAFMNHRDSKAFSRDEVRARVLPAYMGLIKQIDDQMGVLFEFLKSQGRWDDTMIVFTSDHGDYLGDHWLGEKELFHDCSVRIPLIIRDPRKSADATRGKVETRLVEAIDLVPTFVEAAGDEPQMQRLEGRSLMPLLVGKRPKWRECVVSEYDYSHRDACLELGVEPARARIYMVADHKWKYIYYEGYPAQLFDRANDPDELVDLGESAEHEGVRDAMKEQLFAWSRHLKSRTTVSDAEISASAGYDRAAEDGIYIGWWDEDG
jgi:arylsulfatase A-like enzyme